jgi:hypothetical protein
MSTQEAPHAKDRLFSSDRLQALANSPYVSLQLLGLSLQEGAAVIGGVIDTIDERVGTRDDEQGLPLTHRMLGRATEKVEDIEPPALREAVESLASLALVGYGLTRGLIEDAKDQLSEWDDKGF